MALDRLTAAVVKAGRHRGGGSSATRSRRDARSLSRTAFAGFVLLLLGAATTMTFGASSRASAAAPAASKDPPFSISGSVSGLAPGVGSQLPLTVSNPFNFPIRVTSLTVAVGDAGASCHGGDLQVQPFQGSLPVPAHGHATTLLAVTLLNRSPDTCQMATWPLTYGGQAVKISSSGGGGGTPAGGSGATGGTSALGGTSTAPSGGSSSGSEGGTSSGPNQGGLAFTGLTLWILLAAAAALILSGAAILAWRRRRRSTTRGLINDGSWAR